MSRKFRFARKERGNHKGLRAVVGMIVAVICVITVAIGLGFSVKNASAALSENEIYTNLIANTMKKCYNSSEMNASVNIQEYNTYVNGGAANAFANYVLADGSSKWYVPTGIGSGNSLNLLDGTVVQVSCRGLFLGVSNSNGNMTGIFDMTGNQIPQPGSADLANQLGKLGYTETTTSANGRKCINVGYRDAAVSGGGTMPAGSICWDVAELDSSGITDYADFSRLADQTNSGGAVTLSLQSSNGSDVFLSFVDNNSNHCESPSASLGNGDLNGAINKIGSGTCTIEGATPYTVSWNVADENRTSFVSDVRMKNYGLAYRAARTSLFGNGNMYNFSLQGNMYNFSLQERYELYKLYLEKVYGASFGNDCKTRSALSSGPIQTDEYGGTIYYVYYNGGYHNVTIPNERKNYGVATFGSSNNYLESHCNNAECLIKLIYDMDLPETETCSTDPDPNPNPTPGTTENADFDCDTILKKNGGKVGAMQWILCPALNGSAYTANWIDNLSQSMLEIKTDRYDINSGAFKGWEIMRNIANVAMVIFLSVIIFSQLTGYGIDNYGIKKMLPRLIMMALIINLSFYICELAIDLSNIAGEGLRNMFGAFGNDISQSLSGEESVGEAGTGFVTSSLVAIFSAFAASGPAIAAGVAAASLGWVAIVIAALVLVLIIIVAVVTLWLMLGLREIIVIACVILSPLAFACFILPNTQNITKKWWSLFKAAIIVFPICGLVAGVSYLLRGISKSDDGEMGMGIAGRIILFVMPYLVFFLLPMLLKNALAALGKLGGALTSMGQAIRNGGQQIGQAGRAGIQNSQRYKDWSQFRQEQVAAQRAQRIHDRLSGRTDLTRRQQAQLRNADDVLLAQRKKTVENASRATGEFYDAAVVKQDLAVANEQRATQLYNDPNYSAMMEQHGETSLLNEREKMWSEQYASQDKRVNTGNLRNALTGHDAEQAAAAFTTLNSQGVSETMEELYNANWNAMDSGVRNKLLARMSSSNVDSFKSFAKYRQSGGQKSFSDWMNGVGPVEHNVKDASFAAHLNDLEEHAMDSYSKDEMEFINKYAANSLQTQLGASGFGSMLRSAAISSKDPKMQTQAEDIMRKQIGNGTMKISDLGITAENLGSLRGNTLKAAQRGYFELFRSRGYNAVDAKANADAAIRNALRGEIARAKSDNRIYNRMDNDVKRILGM